MSLATAPHSAACLSVRCYPHSCHAGSGYGYGAGVRIDTPIGPLRLEYAMNDRQQASACSGVRADAEL